MGCNCGGGKKFSGQTGKRVNSAGIPSSNTQARVITSPTVRMPVVPRKKV